MKTLIIITPFILSVIMSFAFQQAQFIGWASVFVVSTLIISKDFSRIKFPSKWQSLIVITYCYYFFSQYIINFKLPDTYMIYVTLPVIWYLFLYNNTNLINSNLLEKILGLLAIVILILIPVQGIALTSQLAIFFGGIYSYYFYLFFKVERRTVPCQLFIVASLIIIILCEVRSVLLGALIISVLLLVPSFTRLVQLRKNIAYIIIGGIVLTFVAPIVMKKSKVSVFENLSELNSSGRFEKWYLLLDNFNHYYFGHGHGSASKILLKYSSAFAHPHNDFLRILFEQGSIGLILFTVVLIGLCFIRIKVDETREYFVLPRVFVFYSLPILFFDNIYTYFAFGSGLMILLSFVELKRLRDG